MGSAGEGAIINRAPCNSGFGCYICYKAQDKPGVHVVSCTLCRQELLRLPPLNLDYISFLCSMLGLDMV